MTKVRVLVIDDNAFARNLIHFALGALGVHQIYPVENANDGLSMIYSVTPDMVLVDWMMPDRDGIAFVKKVRADKQSQLRYLPIIMVTAYSEIWRVHEARDAGANEFVVKPFSARTLYGKMRQIIETPRPYIEISEGYFGPDRRRRNVAVPTDRRSAPQGTPPI